MGKRTTLIQNLKKFKQRVSGILPVEKMILFGSRAKGSGRKWSDIDLLVVSKVFDRKRPLERGLELYDYWDLDYPVDFLCYTPKEFKKAKRKIGIASEALKSGVVI